MQEFADQLSAQLSGGSEDYRASAHRNTTIANESGFEVENPGTNDTPRGGKCALWETGGQTRRNPGTENRGHCVMKARKRHAVREMKVGPSEPPCRGRLQTAGSCYGQKPRW